MQQCSFPLVARGCSSDPISEVVWGFAQIDTEVLCTHSPSASLHPQMDRDSQIQGTQPWSARVDCCVWFWAPQYRADMEQVQLEHL